MDNSNDKDKVFPEKYAHLEETLNKAVADIKRIDEQLNGKDKGPAPRYNPPGFPSQGPRSSGVNNGPNKKDLQAQKDKIIDGTLNKIDKGLKGADPKTAKTARSKSLEKLDPNKFSQLSKDEQKKARSQKRDINESQKFASDLIKRKQDEKSKKRGQGKNPESPQDPDNGPKGKGNSKSGSEKHGKSEAGQKFGSNAESVTKDSRASKEPTKDNAKKPMSMSGKFSQSLGYTKAKDNKSAPDKSANKSPSKGKENFKANAGEISKDSRSKDKPKKVAEKKPTSMSSKFNQSLGYSKAKEGNKPTPEKPKDKAPSKTADKLKDNSRSVSKDSRQGKQPEASKPMSMSGRFSQSLGYSKSKGTGGSSPSKSPNSSPSKSSPSKSPSSPGKSRD